MSSRRRPSTVKFGKKIIRRIGGRLNSISADELRRAVPNIFGHDRRRVWLSERRAHVELRDLERDQFRQLAAALREELADHDNILLTDINAVTGRAVFTFEPGTAGWRHFERIVERAEAACGFEHVPFPVDRPKYPSDVEPIARELLEISLDSASVGLGTTLKLIGYEPSSFAFDLAALTTLTENTPRVRQWLEEHLGSAPVNVGLGSASAFFQGISAGPLGPALDLALRAIRVRGELARRVAWEVREPELCAVGRPDEPGDPRCPQRPREVPTGEIEDYADGSFFASLGGFAVGLLDTEDLERSFTPLLGGLPKAARYGREGFIAELTRVLADRGIIAMRPAALERIDRVDTVVVEGRVFGRSDGGLDLTARNFAGAVRGAGMKLVVVSDDEGVATSAGAHEWVQIGPESWRDKTLQETVAQLQREGRVVVAVMASEGKALRVADLGIGLHLDEIPPWSADLITQPNLDEARFVIEACVMARELAGESVVLAGVGALVGSLAAVGRGLEENSPRRVMLAVNVASLVSLSNGVRRARQLAKRSFSSTSHAPPWHAMSVEEVLALVESAEEGLARDQIDRRREKVDRPPTAPRQLARAIGVELMNPFTPILTAGAALSAMVGSAGDALIVGSAVALNALVGGGERFQAERAVRELEQVERDPVCALRDGRDVQLRPGDLVVGDVLHLAHGDVVPADCRIIEANGLEVDESSLTGESLPVTKSAEPSDAENVAERSSMLYAGTSISAGDARAVVVALFPNTEADRSGRLIPEGAGADGVEARLRAIASMTLPVAGYSSAVLASAGLLRDEKITRIVSTGVGLAVASVPEGLPLLATIAQLSAARRLARKGIIVRNPRTIEALGRIDILCADKTGTLTEGTLRLHGVANRNGELVIDEEVREPWAREILCWATRACPPRDRSGAHAHATDEAVIAGAQAHQIAEGDGGAWSAVDELPFGSNRGFHAVLGTVDGESQIAVKGAPEVILPRCTALHSHGEAHPLSESGRDEILAAAERLAGEGLRVLCVARGMAPSTEGVGDADVGELCMLGFVLLSDPIRESSRQAVNKLHSVGIETMMITGDHPRTAARIAHEAGIIEDADCPDGVCITGPEIDAMSDEELEVALASARVVARATPAQKLRIVAGLQRLGLCVAMTGDGGNDASAIRLADVGIALGANSTKAARHAADMIVVDEHLETIVEGIAEGRAMWPSLRDAVSILIGGNLGEIGFTVASGVFGQHAALNARQLLLVNLLTDIAPAMAIALTPPGDETLRDLLGERPEDALGEALDREIMSRAVCTAGGASLAYLASRWLPRGRKCSSTVSLLALVGSQLGQTVAAGRHSPQTLIAGFGSAAVMLGIVETPGLSRTFGCVPVGPVGLSIALSSSLVATVASKLGPTTLDRVASWLDRQIEELDEQPQPERRPIPESDLDLGFPFRLEPKFAYG